MGDFIMNNAYLFKKDATFDDINSLIKELSIIKENYTEFIKNDIKNDYLKDARSIMAFNGMNGLTNKIIEDSNSPLIGNIYDYSLNLAVYFYQEKIIVGAFGSKKSLNYFRETFKHPSYEYYAHVEDDEVLPDDWDDRAEFWNEIFNETGIPANVSLSYDIFNTDIVRNASWDLFKELIEKKVK